MDFIAVDVIHHTSCILKVVSCQQVLDPDLLRNMLKTAFQPPGVSKAIEKAMAKMPAELQHPFEDLLTFAHELDESDLDAIVGDFTALCKQFKTKIPKAIAQLKKSSEGRIQKSLSNFGAMPEMPEFDFPGDILKSIDPLEILAQLGTKIPPPFDAVSPAHLFVHCFNRPIDQPLIFSINYRHMARHLNLLNLLRYFPWSSASRTAICREVSLIPLF